MTSATKEIEITNVETIPSEGHNTFEMTVIYDGRERSLLLGPSQLSSCISSVTQHTESEIRRRSMFSLSSTSLPMESIVGEHKVTENWISTYIKE